MIGGASVSESVEPTSSADPYPSRVGQSSAILTRLDPVVYAQSFEGGPIPRQLVDEYEETGFLVLENVFTPLEVRSLQEEVALLQENYRHTDSETCIAEPGDHTLRSIFAVHKSAPLFEQLACDRRLVELAQFLLGDDVYIHQSRLNFKPGFRGKEFYWHSDFETWHVEDGMPRMRALSMSIALTENTSNNGPLMLIPGSHKHYVACSGQTPENHFQQSLRKQEYGVPSDELLLGLATEGGVFSADAQPGSVIVFDCNTLHGSNSNITPYPRSNAFIVYNSLQNQVMAPYCERPPRPEFICTRSAIEPISIREGGIGSGQK